MNVKDVGRVSALGKTILHEALMNDARVPSARKIASAYWGDEKTRPAGRRHDAALEARYRASISRSIAGLARKGLIAQPWGDRRHELTGQGKLVSLMLTSMERKRRVRA